MTKINSDYIEEFEQQMDRLFEDNRWAMIVLQGNPDQTILGIVDLPDTLAPDALLRVMSVHPALKEIHNNSKILVISNAAIVSHAARAAMEDGYVDIRNFELSSAITPLIDMPLGAAPKNSGIIAIPIDKIKMFIPVDMIKTIQSAPQIKEYLFNVVMAEENGRVSKEMRRIDRETERRIRGPVIAAGKSVYRAARDLCPITEDMSMLDGSTMILTIAGDEPPEKIANLILLDAAIDVSENNQEFVAKCQASAQGRTINTLGDIISIIANQILEASGAELTESYDTTDGGLNQQSNSASGAS